MKQVFFLRFLSLAAMMLLVGLAPAAFAGIVYVSDTGGNVWRYDNVADMAAQDSTTNTGTLVRDASVAGADYADDQDVVADLSSGIIYRIAGNGDIVAYNSVADYIGNANSAVVASGVFGPGNLINGASYDGNTGGFYSVGAGPNDQSNSPNPGDIQIYDSLTSFLAGTPDSVLVSNYNGAVLNFFDPDATPGTTVGNTNFPAHDVDAHYYQVAGNGRLEGFESIAAYDAGAFNRVDITALDAFGRNGLYQAGGAFAVPVPEPTSLAIAMAGIACCFVARRR